MRRSRKLSNGKLYLRVVAGDALIFEGLVVRVGENVRNLHHLAGQCRASDIAVHARSKRMGARVSRHFCRVRGVGCHMKEIAALLIDRTGVSVAECHRGLDQRLEHGLQVEGTDQSY